MIMVLQDGRKSGVDVGIGQTLVIGATNGVARVVRRPNPQGGEPFAPVSVVGATSTFGPFDVVSLFAIECVSGAITYDVTGVASADRTYNKSVTADRRTTIYVPAGSQLTVSGDGTGSLVPVGSTTPIAYTGATQTLGPFDKIATYIVRTITGVINLATAYVGSGGGTPVPVAVITTPAAFTQPGGSQRFNQAKADRGGTWSKGTGNDAGSFAVDAASGIWSVTVAGAGDGLTGLVRVLPLVFTPSDETPPVTQLITVTLTTIAAAASASELYTADFSGVAGTPLSALPGWSISSASAGTFDQPKRGGDGTLVGPASNDNAGNEGTWAVLYDPGGLPAGSRTTFTVAKGVDDFNSVSMFALATGYQNGYALRVLPRAGSVLGNGTWVKQGNVVTDLSNVGNTGYRAGDTVDVTFAVADDGSTVTISMTGDATNSSTYSLSGKTIGTKFGFAGHGGFEPAFMPGKVITAISRVRPVTTLVVTEAPTYTRTNSASYSLNWGLTKPTAIEGRLYDTTGNPVTSWMVLDATITGTTNGSVVCSITAPSAGRYRARFRARNDTPVVAVAETDTFFLQTDAAPFRLGGNIGGTNPIYVDNAIHLNWGKNVTIEPIDGFGKGLIYVPRVVQNGTYNVVISQTGVTLGGGGSTMSVTSTNGVTNTHTVVISGDSDTQRYLEFYGLAQGQSIAWVEATTVGMDGQTFVPASIAGVSLLSGFRNLDMGDANGTPITGFHAPPLPTDKMYPTTPVGGYIPYQDQVAWFNACRAQNPNFKTFWDVVDCGLPLTGGVHSVATRYAFLRDNLASDTEIVLQSANEDQWNTDFGGTRRLHTDALRFGHYGVGTFSNPTTPILIDYDYGKWAPPTGSGDNVLPAFSAGTKISGVRDGVGMAVYTAKRAVAAGSFLPFSGDNDDWARLTTVDLTDAAKRYRSVWHYAMIQTVRGVFGEARFQSQIVPYVQGQATGELFNQLATERTYVPGYWPLVKAVGCGGYFGHDPSLNYNYATATVDNLKTELWASMPFFKRVITTAALDCLAMGKRFYIYEWLTHPEFIKWNTPGSAYRNAWDAFFASADGQAFIAEIMRFVARMVPGIAMTFTWTGLDPWRVKNKWSDVTSARYLGIQQGLS